MAGVGRVVGRGRGGWVSTEQRWAGARTRTAQPSVTHPTTPARCAATKLLYLKRREPEAWARLAHVALPHDYINWWLTGRLVMEVRLAWEGHWA